MDVIDVTSKTINIFSSVLIDAAEWLNSTNRTMWKIEDLTSEELLKKYNINDMKLCYENGILLGVYILQWYDPIFWRDAKEKDSGILHKLAICRQYRDKGFGNKLIGSAQLLCKNQDVKYLRLNCGTFRINLRNFYERNGFKAIDRVFFDNRDQIRYEKLL